MKYSVSFVLGSLNRLHFLKETISSIRSEVSDDNREILVVDGGSTDGSIKWLCEQKDIITIVQHNSGIWNSKAIQKKSWGYFMNLAFRAAKYPVICMLSDDCVLVPGSINKALRMWENNQDTIGAMPFYWRNGGNMHEYFVSTFHGIPFVNHGFYSASVLKEIGYADEKSFKFYSGDIDICLRIHFHGKKIIPCKDALVEHWPHLPGDSRPFNEEKMKDDNDALFTKWTGMISDLKTDERISLNFIHDMQTDQSIVNKMMQVEKKMRRKDLPKEILQKIRRKIKKLSGALSD